MNLRKLPRIHGEMIDIKLLIPVYCFASTLIWANLLSFGIAIFGGDTSPTVKGLFQ